MLNYLDLVKQVMRDGKKRTNRTGINTISIFGAELVHDMSQGMPILTTKKINFRACVRELLWFLKGDTNIKYLTDNNVHIWDAWADKNGDLGPIYGKQWTQFGPNKVNQIDYIINEIKTNPYSRRIVLCGWNPSDMQDMSVPPCHVLYQFYADPASKKLSLQVYMRSADIFLGLPFDIAEGAVLLSIVAKVTGYKPHMLRYTLGDAHIYVNHLEQISTQLNRSTFKLPTLELPEKSSIYDYAFEDIKLIDYKHHSFLKGDVAV